ncbi:MAG: flagellar biosynthesis regulator FlaF [Paracoccaceae bacterium]|nr:flagellar biosynthesis regulator FlaF [Paracoccaceae bacterium]
MNAIDMARTAYGAAAATPVGTARSTEFKALAQISHRLREAIKRGKSDYPGLVAALHDNRRIWTLFASSVAQGDNALPPKLRARLLYLSEFTRHTTQKVLRGEDDGAVLIEINAAVLRGLANGEGA